MSPPLLSHLDVDASDSTSVHLLFTTNPGLEDIVGEELCSQVRDHQLPEPAVELRPFGFGGHVLARLAATPEAAWMAASRMRSVHHVLRPLYIFHFEPMSPDPLGSIYETLLERGASAMETADSFRVTTKRSGDHPFTSLDVQRVAGAALNARYGTRVDLLNFELNVRVDIFGDMCIVGIQLTDDALSKRFTRLYSPGPALKSNVAYALLRFARMDSNGVELADADGALLDPFCGSGTILIEAAQLFPRLQILGSDISSEAVDGASRNIAAAGLSHRVHVACGDALEMSQTFGDERIGTIVANPPYGVRLSRGLNFFDFYSKIMAQSAQLLASGGRLVFIAWKRGVVDRANQRLKLFRRRHVRVVETGGIYPRIYVLERK